MEEKSRGLYKGGRERERDDDIKVSFWLTLKGGKDEREDRKCGPTIAREFWGRFWEGDR